MKPIARLVATAVAAALLAAGPGAAGAAMRRIRIRPNDLQRLAAHQADLRVGLFNRGDTGTALFWRTLRLPRGARIRGLSYRRVASAANPTVVAVDRVRAGAAPSWQRLFVGTSTQVAPPGSTGEIVTGTPTAVTKIVQRGWAYFVLVQANVDAGVGDVVVRYSVP